MIPVARSNHEEALASRVRSLPTSMPNTNETASNVDNLEKKLQQLKGKKNELLNLQGYSEETELMQNLNKKIEKYQASLERLKANF